MKQEYVTHLYFNYMPQFLALYMSLNRNVTNFRLWVVCLDEKVQAALSSFDERVRTILFDERAPAEVLATKTTRSIGEYCWTVTPFLADLVFDCSDAEHITYIDCDCWFARNPMLIFDEFFSSGKSCLISKHAYHPDYDQSITSGVYCVQFIIFDRVKSRPIRDQWSAQCLQWCYNRVEDGKFGDQKYLESWPYQFSREVHVLADESRIMGPWSAKRFPYSDADIWHFHGLRLKFENEEVKVNINSHYELPSPTFEAIYQPYIRDINNAVLMLKMANQPISAQV